MVFYIVIAVAGGILLGWKVLPPALVSSLDGFINYALAFMVFTVGIDIGRNREALKRVKELGFKILLVPLAVALGSLLGASVAVIVLPMPLKEVLAVGAGFGWYSLSGVLIANTYSVELGTIAFLANVVRELMAFVLIPFLVSYVGKIAAIAPGGATTMDSTLPLITRVTDAQTALVAFMSGLLLTGMVPLLIPFILSI
jgi:uncharacterized membrane protein YbjE (DUF340 family)